MGKVVLITGASAGMGLITAQHLAAKGHKVYGASRSALHGKIIDNVIQVKMDVSNGTSVFEAITFVLNQEGKIDVLVNNAGIGFIGSIEDTSDREAKEVFETNVFGLMNVCRAILPSMREAKSGLIINISSIAGLMGLPYRGIYSASKYSVIAITEALSAEVKKYGVWVCAVLPGDFKTSVNDNRRLAQNASQSAYTEECNVVNNAVISEVEKSPNPIEIAQKIEAIIDSKKPKLLYKVAKPIPVLSTILHFFLPGRWFEKIIMNHYKM